MKTEQRRCLNSLNPEGRMSSYHPQQEVSHKQEVPHTVGLSFVGLTGANVCVWRECDRL